MQGGIQEDNGEFEHLHPLENPWTFWYDKPVRKNVRNWEQNIHQISKCITVEDFWRIYNNIIPASQLPTGCNYYLFHSDIEPKWEDPNNQNGGKWYLVFKKNKLPSIDDRWLNSLLACIGETLENQEICGVVCSIRKSEDRISFWTRDSNEEVTLSIGNSLKELLQINNGVIEYITHKEASKMAKKIICKYKI